MKKILHIVNSSIYIDKFRNFIKDNNFNFSHDYLVLANNKEVIYENGYEKSNLGRIDYIIPGFDFLVKDYQKVFIHGLFDNRLILNLYFNKKYLYKFYWIIWGGDFYFDFVGHSYLKRLILRYLKKIVVRKIRYMISYLENEVNLVKNYYKSEAIFLNCICYPNLTFEGLNSLIVNTEYKSPLKILVGNSSSINNYQIEVFEKIKFFNDIQVYTPLSYGPNFNREIIINCGNSIFGEKFFPITKFINYEEYKSFLNKIDIAIFNHKHQEAMGNILLLLYFGKKVYLNSKITSKEFFDKLGIVTYSINDISDYSEFINLDYNTLSNNSLLVSNIFTAENLIAQWKEIFDN